MRPRPRTLGILVLLGAVLALALVVVIDARRDSAAIRRVTGIDPDAPETLVLTWRDGRRVALARGARGWRVREPFTLAADPARVAALLGVLRAESLDGFRAAGNDLASFGLEPPRARLAVDGRMLVVGDTEPIEGLRYVLWDGEVHLVRDTLYRHLAADPAGFVHPSPLGPEAEPVGFELPGVTLARSGEGWRVRPASAAPGADAPNALADAWRYARAIAVERFDDEAPWEERIAVRLAPDDAGIEFLLARGPDGLVLGRPGAGVQYRFPRSAGEGLLALRLPGAEG